MDEETQRQSQRIQAMNEKYLTGGRNKGGAAYNILSLQYDPSNEGEFLRQRDDDSKVRALCRSKNIDVRSNCGFNPINGSDRRSVEVPVHKVYNNQTELQSVGASIMGTGFAGKPVRKELFELPRTNTQPAYQRDPMGYNPNGGYAGGSYPSGQSAMYPPPGGAY